MEIPTRIIAFPAGKIQGAGDPATELPSEVLTAPRLISPSSTQSAQILMHRFDLVVIKFGNMAMRIAPEVGQNAVQDQDSGRAVLSWRWGQDWICL